MSTKTKDFIAAWNGLFFPNGKYKEAFLTVQVTIELPTGEIATFNASHVTPKTNINELARSYVAQAQAPAENGVEDAALSHDKTGVEEKSPKKKEVEDDVIANEHIKYRNNEYLVQHYIASGEEKFTIKNLLSNADIGTNTITGRGILKKYRAKKNSVESPPEE